jgi:hypothetical protein
MGRGRIPTSTSRPVRSGEGKAFTPPEALDHVDVAEHDGLPLPVVLGARRKSSGCHPEATETPTRPPDRLSTTDHSSATRTGWWRGGPRFRPGSPREVMAATAAPTTAGLG